MSPKQDQGSTYLYPKLCFSLWAMHPSDQPSVTPPMSLLPCFSVSITGQRLYTAAALAKTRIFIFAGWKLIVDGNCSQYKVALAVAWAGQMSKFQELKRELSILEKTFGSDHEHLRVEANGLDEVTYRFLAPNGEHVVHCNIYVSRSFIFCTCQWFFKVLNSVIEMYYNRIYHLPKGILSQPAADVVCGE